MALKYGTENVTDVTYKVGTTNHVVTLIKNSNDVVYWARPGSISLDTKTGISRTDASREATLEPTASTGTLSGAATVYHGDTLTIYGTPEPYWTVDPAVSATVDFLTTKVFSASSVLNPTRKLRSIVVYNPDRAAQLTITYTDASGESQTYTMPTYSMSSFSISNTWCGDSVQYSSVALSPSSDIWFKNATSGTIAAQDDSAPAEINMEYKTFNLRTYPNGTITYYSNPEMTTVITQSKYSTSVYYKYTRGSAYLFDGTNYTTALTGTVPTDAANVSGNTWGAFVTEPEAYAKLRVTLNHRGRAYWKLPSETTWKAVGKNTPGIATYSIYIPVTVGQYQICARYVGPVNSLTGLTTSTYGSSNDTYTSTSSYKTDTLHNIVDDVYLRGTLKPRTVTINQVKAAHNTGVSLQYYSTLTGEPVTYSNVHLDKLMPTDVWAGATVTRSATGTFVPATGWTTSGYVGTTAIGTTAMSANVYATYTYMTSSYSSSTTSASRQLAVVFTAPASAGIVGTGQFASNIVTASLASSASMITAGVASTGKVTIARSSPSNTNVTAILSNQTKVTITGTFVMYPPTLAAPALRYGSDHASVVVYNPNTIDVTYATHGLIQFTDSDGNVSTIPLSGSIAACTTQSYYSANSYHEISLQANAALNAANVVTSPTSTLDWS